MKCEVCGMEYAGQEGAPCPHGRAHRRQWDKEQKAKGKPEITVLGVCDKHRHDAYAELCSACVLEDKERDQLQLTEMADQVATLRQRIADRERLIEALKKDSEYLRATVELIDGNKEEACTLDSPHDWVEVTNEKASGCEICLKCGMIRGATEKGRRE